MRAITALLLLCISAFSFAAPAEEPQANANDQLAQLLFNDPNSPRTGAKAPKLTIVSFTDYNCPYCKQFWQQSRPWVDAGKGQIRTLLVGVIKPESPVTAAAILASKDPAKTWHDYEQSNGKMALTIPKAIPPEKMKMLNVNQQLMDDLGANVTPAIYYMNKDNMLQQVVGLPDKEKLQIMMGEKK